MTFFGRVLNWNSRLSLNSKGRHWPMERPTFVISTDNDEVSPYTKTCFLRRLTEFGTNLLGIGSSRMISGVYNRSLLLLIRNPEKERHSYEKLIRIDKSIKINGGLLLLRVYCDRGSTERL